MSWRPLKPVVLAAIIFSSVLLCAQTPKDAAHQWRVANEQQILQEFTGLLSIPNVASDTGNIRRNADTLVQALEHRHVAASCSSRPAPIPSFMEVETKHLV